MARHRWEYHTVSVPVPLDRNVLAEAGRERWELVSTIPLANGDVQLVFKRPEPSLQDRITAAQRDTVLEGSS